MLIIHAIDSMDLGGAQTLLYELYHAIKKYHPTYKQSIVCIRRPHFHIKERTTFKDKLSYNTVERSKFVKYILSQKNAILFYHKLMISDTGIYRKIRKSKRIPIICINHSFSTHERYNVFERCDVIVSVCDNMCKKLKSLYPDRKHAVVKNAVNYKFYRSINPLERDRRKTFFTGRVNKFNRIKHPPDWIEWCGKLKLPKKMLHEYIGGGAYEHQAKIGVKKKSRNWRNNVQILGRIDNFKKKVSIMKSWDVFLYEIVNNEGISMSILESLACGIPVICSNHYGNKEVIEPGINGFIFKNRKEASAILTDLCNDKEKLKKLKKTTEEHFIEHLDAKFMAKKYIGLVEKILAKYRKRNAI